MKLAKREKRLVCLAILSIAVFLLLQFLVFPFFGKMGRIRRGVNTKQEALKEIVMLSAEYKAHKTGSERIQKLLSRRKKGFTLFSFLEKAAGQAKVKDHIKYMKPSTSQGTGPHKESMVQMELDRITLKQLVEYLYRIESAGKAISIKRIEIKKNKRETGFLNAVIHVLTFQD